MKTYRTTLAIAVLALVTSGSAMAQTTTKSTAKPDQTTGEMSPQQKVDEGMVKGTKPAPSTEDRKKLQAEAAAANKAGTNMSGECSPEQKADAGACKKPPMPASTTTREQVKKEGTAAAKSGQTTTGEMTAPQKKDAGAAK